jgi:hypothetical protein
MTTTDKMNSRGFKLEESAIKYSEKEAASTMNEQLSAKRLRRRKQKLAVVRKRKIRIG